MERTLIDYLLGRAVTWDPTTKRFLNKEEADQMLSRKQRAPYGTNNVS
jgi:hypothetical protein